jgi:glycosyltransferase involved in cell wall biosynthesis
MGVGGMVSFQAKLASSLTARKIDVCFDLNDFPYDAVLVIAGSRYLPQLWRAKRRGIRIVQRLDGMNWIHRRRWTGVRHFIKSEYSNWLMAFIRSFLADHIIYQSEFTHHWWERKFGKNKVPCSIVYNAVDLDAYSPDGVHHRPTDAYRLLMVEGSLKGGHEVGIETAVRVVEKLNADFDLDRPVELMVVGQVAEQDRLYWDKATNIKITWGGVVPREKIPEIDRSAHLIYPAEINAACPNSVIEALACGLPALAFVTGSLPELIQDGAGKVVPYGSDPEKLGPPDIDALASAGVEVLQNQDKFRASARQRAVKEFDLEKMVDRYLEVLFP